jgi:hypothetical protein
MGARARVFVTVLLNPPSLSFTASSARCNREMSRKYNQLKRIVLSVFETRD